MKSGPLSSSNGSEPNRRARKPLLRRLFPEYRTSVLASGSNTLEEHYDLELVVERVAGADPWLRQVGHLLDRVKAELGSRKVTAKSDPLFTETIRRAPEPDEVLLEETLNELVASICDDLTGDESRSIDELKRLFDDPVQRDVLAQALESAWASRPESLAHGEEEDEYARNLDTYLAAVGFDSMGKAAIGHSTGEEAWWLAAALDAPGAMLIDLSAVGLSNRRVPVPPSLDGDERGAPLDQSIYRRLWSVLKGASSREWRRELPEVPAMARSEIEGSASPLGVRTATARAGLSAGARAYSAITPDEPTKLLFDHPGAVGYLNRKVARFVGAVGGFAWLDATAQDQLLNADRALIPGLWTKLHNAEYRRDVTTNPTWVWGQVAGEVETLLREIREDHAKSRVGVSNRAWFTAGPSNRLEPSPLTAVDSERDARVLDALARFHDARGSDATEDMLRMRDREAWEVAVGEAATWSDLLGYLDDHLPRD